MPQPASPTSTNATIPTGAAGETKPRKYKTGEAEAIIHSAITAIINHNNLPGQPHDLKWAITINGLKNFSTNQRVIERIIGERKEDASLFRLIL